MKDTTENPTSFTALLGGDRLESKLLDAKPLYQKSEARAEAERCLFCHDAPCVKACPTGIDIPLFIKKIASGNVLGSAKTIFESNILGYSCARVCPVEELCVGKCVYNDWHRPPIQIGKLQRYATEIALDLREKTGRTAFAPPPVTEQSKKIALIGAGPASLACAAYLRLAGHKPTVFEKNRIPGGLNTTGVAPYKMHAEDSLREVEFIASLGVEIRCGIEAGKDISAAQLLSDYDAVFIGVGLGADSRLNIPGEDGPGVFGAVDFIEHLKTQPGFFKDGVSNAMVIGGGNTAIDVARELALLGIKQVTMVYRRSAAEMPGYKHEMNAARLEGVALRERSQPMAVLRGPDGCVRGLQIAATSEGRPLPGTETELACDLIVMAIGQAKLSALASQFEGVAVDKRGNVVVDAETKRTGNPRVYAGGDCIHGGELVVTAVADGRKAAQAMMQAWSSNQKDTKE